MTDFLFDIMIYYLFYYSRLYKVIDVIIFASTAGMAGLQTLTCLGFGWPV